MSRRFRFAAIFGFVFLQTLFSYAGGKLSFHAELSAREIVNASVLLVQISQTPLNTTASDISVKYQGLDYPVFQFHEGFEAVMGVPYNAPLGLSKVEVTLKREGNILVTALPFTVKDGNYPSEVLTVDAKHVNPQKNDVRRIQKESKEIGKIYHVITREKYWNGPFQLPVASVVTSTFGNKRVFNGEMKSFHQGLDLKAPIGTPIAAAAGGVVVLAKDLFMTGNTVLIDHGYGIFTVYAHMSKLQVKKGQKLKAGEILGLSGMTGRASGPHLHWGAVINRSKVNPSDLTTVLQ